MFSILANHSHSHSPGHTHALAKKQSKAAISTTTGGRDDEWYIPYNGPYEAPPPRRDDASFRSRKARDSWGDPIEDDVAGDPKRSLSLNGNELSEDEDGEDDDETREMYKRYGYGRDEFGGGMKYGVHGVFDDRDRKARGGTEDRSRGRSMDRGRDRTFSVLTTSSGAVDPSRASLSTAHHGASGQRRSTVSAAHPPPVPSYIALDGFSAGGVGESPVPNTHKNAKDPNRISLASIFNFGQKIRLSASPTRSIEAKDRVRFSSQKRVNGRVERERDPVRRDSTANSVSSSVDNEKLRAGIDVNAARTRSSPNKHDKLAQLTQGDRLNSLATDDEDYYSYYNSYYSMLDPDDPNAPLPHVNGKQLSRPGSRLNHQSSTTLPPAEVTKTRPAPILRQNSAPSPPAAGAGHPYAYPYAHTPQTQAPAGDVDDDRIPSPPQSAPLPSASGVQQQHQQQRYPYHINTSNAHSYSHHPYGHTNTTSGTPGAPPKLTLSPTAPPNTADVNQQPYSASGGVLGSAFGSRGVGGLGLGLSSGLAGKQLKNSTSTPNLRASQQHVNAVAGPSHTHQTHTLHLRPPQGPQPPPYALPKGKDRWLSAETWCDALLFPRPRLKLKQDEANLGHLAQASSSSFGLNQPTGEGQEVEGADVVLYHPSPVVAPLGSGRIVSPPGSPLGAEFGVTLMNGIETQIASPVVGPASSYPQKVREPGIASRVLAHSRSLVDLRAKNQREKEAVGYPNVSEVKPVLLNEGENQKQKEKPPRPRSFAQDDLALPTPVPSLAHVLAEGELLEHQRQAWQAMATSSFGNKRARSLSRTRAKSMTQKGRAAMMGSVNGRRAAGTASPSMYPLPTTKGHHHQSSMEYLAAQACLGNQNIAMTPTLPGQKISYFGDSQPAHSKAGTHSHSNSHSTSVAKTVSGTTTGTHTTTTSRSGAGTGTTTSRTHSRNHSRNDSWSKSVKAKSSKMAKFCGDPAMDFDDIDFGSAGLGRRRGQTVSGGASTATDVEDEKAALLAGMVGGKSHYHQQQQQMQQTYPRAPQPPQPYGYASGYPSTDVASHKTTPDLEGALRRDGTRVIKLADPAHLPVDKGLPVSPMAPTTNQNGTYQSLGAGIGGYQRKTPSPALSGSAISESKVGIALGTPPEEDQSGSKEAEGGPATYIPVHPYAQGGLSFSNQHQKKPSQEFAGPHPSVLSAANAAAAATIAAAAASPKNKIPPIADILARHKLPPHLNLAMHPYAVAPASDDKKLLSATKRNENRDSYLDANGLVGQFRSEDSKPHASRMWAQLSPGVVREVLPGDLQYSPYNLSEAEDGGEESGKDEGGAARKRANRETVMSIHDTAGVASALIDAERYEMEVDRRATGHQVRTTGPSRPHQQQQKEEDEDDKDVWIQSTTDLLQDRKRNEGRRRPANLLETQKPSNPSTNHTIASSHIGSSSRLDSSLPDASLSRSGSGSLLRTHSSPEPYGYANVDAGRDSTSLSGSPQLRPLGSPNDLESFQDLFYRPSTSSEHGVRQLTSTTPKEAALPDTPAWDVTMRNRRTGSGLTSLARQLNEEYEALALEQSERRGEEGVGADAVTNGEGLSMYSHLRTLSTGSMMSMSMSMLSQKPTLSRRPTEASLEFVFKGMGRSEPPMEGMDIDADEGRQEDEEDLTNIFGQNGNLPEDVQSSRASSIIENPAEYDDLTAMLRVGMVESVSTPPAINSERRFSFNGETVFAPEALHVDNDDTIRLRSPLRQGFTAKRTSREHDPDHRAHDSQPHSASSGSASSPRSPTSTDHETRSRILSGLQAPPTEATRSSYMTTSDVSRMSGLSDFPIPPINLHPLKSTQNQGLGVHLEPIASVGVTPQHVSLLSSYFDSEFKSNSKDGLVEGGSVPRTLPPPPVTTTTSGSNNFPRSGSSSPLPDSGIHPQRPHGHGEVEFGDNQSAAELAKTLSSPSPLPFQVS